MWTGSTRQQMERSREVSWDREVERDEGRSRREERNSRGESGGKFEMSRGRERDGESKDGERGDEEGYRGIQSEQLRWDLER
eukprot:1324890-Amorphochlora_amoeboformis.AAC.1